MLQMSDMARHTDEEIRVSGSASDFLAEVLIKMVQGLFTGSAGGQ
ncbi:Uncharacterised protein [Nocardia otitidiscaviarum]|uniref:Uncharacterized protein n=1 Tax=Nocardia otitidiscaviarum TaxID=1823 RepID=A0A379JKP9_9NOCA|nr:Uncharacterised protein [Nocardia otitidiscaviarum]